MQFTNFKLIEYVAQASKSSKSVRFTIARKFGRYSALVDALKFNKEPHYDLLVEIIKP